MMMYSQHAQAQAQHLLPPQAVDMTEPPVYEFLDFALTFHSDTHYSYVAGDEVGAAVCDENVDPMLAEPHNQHLQHQHSYQQQQQQQQQVQHHLQMQQHASTAASHFLLPYNSLQLSQSQQQSHHHQYQAQTCSPMDVMPASEYPYVDCFAHVIEPTSGQFGEYAAHFHDAAEAEMGKAAEEGPSGYTSVQHTQQQRQHYRKPAPCEYQPFNVERDAAIRGSGTCVAEGDLCHAREMQLGKRGLDQADYYSAAAEEEESADLSTLTDASSAEDSDFSEYHETVTPQRQMIQPLCNVSNTAVLPPAKVRKTLSASSACEAPASPSIRRHSLTQHQRAGTLAKRIGAVSKKPSAGRSTPPLGTLAFGTFSRPHASLHAAAVNEDGEDEEERTPSPEIDSESHQQLSSQRHSPSQQQSRGITKDVRDLLKQWILSHAYNPYPSEVEKQQLLNMTGIDMTQLNNWFINARRRILFRQYRTPEERLALSKNYKSPLLTPAEMSSA